MPPEGFRRRRLAPRLALTAALGLGFTLARLEGWDGPAAAAAAALIGLALTARLDWPRRVPLVAALALGGGTLGLWPGAAAVALQCLPVAGNALLAAYFATSLRPGAEPVIARCARFDWGSLPPECADYARGLTALWAAVFAALAIANALPLAASGVAAGAVLAADALVLAALFLGEHVVRSRRFPQFGPASPRRTLRAMWLAGAATTGGARHAG